MVDPIPEFAAAVLDVVDLIPAGRAMTYGDVAEYLGRGGPRQVGQVMARWGGAVAWWRVLKADGSPPPGHEAAALQQYRRERTPLRADGRRVDLRAARWDGVPAVTGTTTTEAWADPARPEGRERPARRRKRPAGTRRTSGTDAPGSPGSGDEVMGSGPCT